MLRLAHNDLKKFLNEFDQCLEEKRDSLFTAELGFSKDGMKFSKIWSFKSIQLFN